MHEEAVNAAISIHEGMNEDEPESRSSGGAHRMNSTLGLEHAPGHGHPSVHQRGDVVGLGANEMNLFGKVWEGLTDINLDIPPVFLRVAGIDDGILQLDQGLLRGGIELVGPNQRRYEAFRAVLAWLFSFDGK